MEHAVLMVANTVPERVVWAVEMLDVAPDDRLLEIGCGAGHAVSLICAQLDTGAITAIDCSALMINLALQRNHGHLQPAPAVCLLAHPSQ